MSMDATSHVVGQALDDLSLRPAARLTMWALGRRLDCVEYREVKLVSLAKQTGFEEPTVSGALAMLIARGYLDVRTMGRRSRGFRLPLTRRVDGVRVLPDTPHTAKDSPRE